MKIELKNLLKKNQFVWGHKIQKVSDKNYKIP